MNTTRLSSRVSKKANIDVMNLILCAINSKSSTPKKTQQDLFAGTPDILEMNSDRYGILAEQE
jgi:hypothetical protein